MSAIAYTVAVQFPNSTLAEEWLAWLRHGHIAEVIAGGATAAEVVKLDGDACAYEVRYRFPSRAAFTRYEKEHAPRLRAEGLAKFPVEQGVAYKRTLGEVIWSS